MKTLLATAFLALAATPSFAALIDFESIATGTAVSTQYAGVSFVSGSGGTTIPASTLGLGTFATTTDLTVVSSTGTDVGGLGTPAGTVSGNILRSFNGWLGENGDAVFTMNFTSNISAISVAFAGVANLASTRVFAVNASNAVVSTGVFTATTGQGTISLTGLSGIKKIVVTPGDYNDWVGVDNINYTPVPEPTTLAALGLGGLAVLRRRKRA